MSIYPKRLIEVDLPIKRISAHARREKSIRHGHISTLHIWWARRPLAACRAVICASLWPDPADELCPQAFRDKATELITHFAKEAMSNKSLAENCSEESLARWNFLSRPENRLNSSNQAHLNILRFALLDFIADFANWDNSTVPEYLETSRALTQAAHEALGGEPGSRPLVVDPFAGGGAIPLEALRVGADAFASDLNPVAVLLNKVILEFIPKYGQKLVNEVRKWGKWIGEQAEKELAEFYPIGPDGAMPIAYLWARTIQCEGPGCGANIPLINSFWLGKKQHNPWSLSLTSDFTTKQVEVNILREPVKDENDLGTIKRGAATCPCCGYTTPIAKVRSQLFRKRGGAASARFLCVVTIRANEPGRFYILPTKNDFVAVQRAFVELERRKISASGQFSFVPDEPTPKGGGKGAGRAFSQRSYGMDTFETLFTPRQALALGILCDKVRMAGTQVSRQYEDGFGEAVQTVLALNVNKLADYCSALASWSTAASQETVRSTFSRQALTIAWDFAEAYPFASSSGGWTHNLEFLLKVIEMQASAINIVGTVAEGDATHHVLPDDSAVAFMTDPPYYDAIPFADLSDFFLVWLRRSLDGTSLGKSLPLLSPKENECVVDETKGHDHSYFVRIMKEALQEGRRLTIPSGIGVIWFAHKSTTGWEAQLQALIDAGWTITGSWPLDTERQGRMRANNSAALSSSIHLVCRPRENPYGLLRSNDIGDWRDVLTKLPKRIHEWMPRLADEGVVGADAIFACLGPALEIFSRYSAVEKASGEKVTLKEYLEEVWAAVSREALKMIFEGADASGFEEDARLTAMWLWTLRTALNGGEEEDSDESDSRGGTSKPLPGYRLEYDAARKIAQGLGAHLEKLSHLVEIKGDTATLLSAAARTSYLFGKDAAAAPKGKRKKQISQLKFDFAETLQEIEETSGNWSSELTGKPGSTVLDQLHQAMILFAAGRGEALKRFLVEDGVGRNPLFWRLAQALSALYPAASDEKRWVDGVLARKKGLGL